MSLNSEDDLEQTLKNTKLTMIKDKLIASKVPFENLWDLEKNELEAIGLNDWEKTRYLSVKERMNAEEHLGKAGRFL